MDKFYRQAWIDIDLDNLYFNLQEIRALFPAGIYVMAVVKADAYGHGILPVARFLESRMINYLGVASLDEAVFLRQQGIKTPILVLGETRIEDLQVAQFYGITLTVASRQFAEALRRYVANSSDCLVKIHVKVDTGMHRLGLSLSEAEGVITQLFVAGIELEGIFSHFSSADSDPVFTLEQISRFSGLIRRLSSWGIEFKLRHISNSAGLVFRRAFEGLCNMIRPGIALYGAYPSYELSNQLNLKPVLSLKSRIVMIRRLKKGEGLGYNHAYIAPDDRVIGVVPVGYGDGYPRSLSNRAQVLVRERRCPVIGKICMDQLFVDLSELDEASVGDEVVLIGRQGMERITVEEMASWCNTISYEILCQLGRRLHRKYLSRKFNISYRDALKESLRSSREDIRINERFEEEKEKLLWRVKNNIKGGGGWMS